MMGSQRRFTLNVKPITANPRKHVMLLTLASFLLGSTGWLMWLYHLTGLASPAVVDMHTMGVGYLMQSTGIAWFIVYGRMQGSAQLRRTSTLAIACYVACLALAALLPGLGPTLAFGYLANLFCGFFQGYYVYCLAAAVDTGHRGMVFGSAYAASTVLGWLLSVVAGGALTHGITGLLTCALIAVLTVLLVREPVKELAQEPGEGMPVDGGGTQVAVLACVTVVLLSLTKNAGFGFPTSDLLEGVSLESSRLFYGVGLLAAGLVNDRDRRYGALCCVAALVTPFLMLSLSGAAAPATILWVLGYLLFGFFSVFRVLLLADLAANRERCLEAGAGLAAGRVGDAVGTMLTILFAKNALALITASAACFALTMALFFVLYQQLYVPQAKAAPPSERELFERFAAHHDLSARERDVLRLVLAERSNAEIAAELFVSEATVKYHVRNLLRKTGCKTRLEVLAKYAER